MAKINPNLYTPIAIVVAGVIIAIGVFFALHSNSPSAAPSNGTTPTANVNAKDVSAKGNPTIGDPNAPLTIAYWFDYQCPFCKENELQSMSQVVKDYVDTGKVKIVFKDFSFLGPDSDTLGHAARAVWAVAPDKFEAWHQAVYAAQGQENSGWVTTAKIRQITASVLTPAQTDQVMQLMVSNAKDYQAAMDADKQEGEQDGVQGTPALLIGNQMIAGAYPYAQIKSTIDAQLK
ncbi:MAG TPA: thioredoxin domain-containing protein [Candidatus Paceibacterota bacterium]|nr:thioredoxin domain-containing protein [Candidatus Paceibacterota bacterium]